jgi:hypothetical protein
VLSDATALARLGTALLAVHGYSWLAMLKETWILSVRPLGAAVRRIAAHAREQAA